ncbi:MAG: hypothetical protein Kow0098_08000 [Ignavibacteriaceae bacterium]
MQACPEIQSLYQLHIKHLPVDGIHLGTAESLQEVIDVMDKIDPESYSLVKSCVDGAVTIKLLRYPTVRRIRLNLLDRESLIRLIEILGHRNVKYKEDKYLSLNKDFSATNRCRWQERIWLYYKLKFFVLRLRNKIFY